MLLKDKIAIIFGGGGAIGGAVAKAFAGEGARVFLAGRSIEKLEAVVRQISGAGGRVEIARIDALNKQEVENQLNEIVKKTGSIDISFNAIGLNDTQGLPLTEMVYDQFASPIITAMQGYFITSAAVVKHMRKKGTGVILAITANAGRKPYPNTGGFGVACAAIEGYCRQLAAEVGEQGIRVVCIRSAGSPDAPGVDEVFKLHAKNAGITREAFDAGFADSTMLKRLPKLNEVANVALLMASDKASAITAAVVNVTCGELAD
ncbi:MAG: Short-chain dehydrogenase/reductase [Chitinophagaceae bacterium]|nr:Short-chain dehydrogenase/reductase [Chitinophagaceae bacterium]